MLEVRDSLSGMCILDRNQGCSCTAFYTLLKDEKVRVRDIPEDAMLLSLKKGPLAMECRWLMKVEGARKYHRGLQEEKSPADSWI